MSDTRINDGGPAFPVSVADNTWMANRGMTLRDWFAGQAPDRVKYDFPVRMDMPRPEPIETGIDGYPANSEEISAWDEEHDRQRAIQWPYVWADAMLAERDKETK